MLKRKLLFAITGVITSALVSIGAVEVNADEKPQIVGTEQITESDDYIYLGLQGSYLDGLQAALDRVNEIRYEACEEGIINSKTGVPLTLDDYHPLQWSTDLESIARVRAIEASITVDHKRLTSKSIWSVKSNGMQSWGENLAWNCSTDPVSGIEQFYDEKEDYLKECRGEEHKQTGHYTSMINPAYRYVGIGCFITDMAAYPYSHAMELGYEIGPAGGEMLEGLDNIIQVVEVDKDLVSNWNLSYSEEIYKDEITELSARAQISYGDCYTNKGDYNLIPIGEVTFSSDNNEVATCTPDGAISGLAFGKTNINIFFNGELVGTKAVEIVCRHEYEYSDIDSDGYITGTCKKCNDIIKVKPVTDGSFYWSNLDTDNDSTYCSVVPFDNPVGSTIAMTWYPSDGYKGYRDLIVTNSNPEVLDAPELVIEGWSENTFIVKGSGATTLTFTAKYNKNFTASYVIWVGNEGSINIADAKVEVENPSAMYTGDEITNRFTVTYDGYEVNAYDYYTITYSNNINVGTATATIKGKGLFTGEKKVEFKIEPRNLSFTQVNLYTSKYEYAGEPISPQPYVTYGFDELVKDVDYTLSYEDNNSPGLKYVTVTGIGNFTGSRFSSFIISHSFCKYGNWYVENEATCTKDGSERRDCAYCDNYEKKSIDSIGHKYKFDSYEWDGNLSCNAKFICENDKTHIHNEYLSVKGEVTTKPTYEKDGVMTYTATGDFDDVKLSSSKTEVIPKLESKPVTNTNPFVDVKNGKYYTESILYLNSKGVMTGLNSTTFGFNRLLNREDMVTLLWKNEGKPSMNVSSNVFKDIAPKKYYTDAVAWAKKYNIVGGYTSGAKAGCFGKGDSITRQDFIKIIYGYAKYKGFSTTVKSENTYTEKTDASKVSKYARESMNWAYEKGLVGQGSPLNPKGNITRQDAAVIIARFLKAF